MNLTRQDVVEQIDAGEKLLAALDRLSGRAMRAGYLGAPIRAAAQRIYEERCAKERLLAMIDRGQA
jgi:hypothetical protein